MQSPKEVNVEVLVTTDASKPEGVKFELQSNLGTNDELKFNNKKHPGFIVNFNVVDPDGTGCLFLPDPKDAMWVQTFDPGTSDPCPRSAMCWDQFMATDVKKQQKQLVVRNMNEYQQMFAFSLRFSKPGWPDPILYDPIGDNRNGPVQLNMFALTVGVALVGVAALAAFTVFAD